MLDAAMGSFYTRCHMFSNALNYYEAAVKKGNKELRMEYGKLLVKLKRFDRAEVVLREIIDEKDQGGDTQNDLVKVRAALSLAAVYEMLDTDMDERIRLWKETYNRAESLQTRSRNASTETMSEATEFSSRVLNALVDAYFKKREPKQAIQLLKQALTSFPPAESPSLLCLLSSAHLQSADVTEAYRTIREAQKLQPDFRQVYLISADIAIRRKDFDHAVTLYREFLAKFPEDYVNIAEVAPSLARLGSIQVLRKHLDELSNSVTVRHSPGYSLCEGLCLRYTGSIEAATKVLKTVLQGKSQLSAPAGKALVEMLCNFDFEMAGSQSLPSSSTTTAHDLTKRCEEIYQSISESLRKSNPGDAVLLSLPVLYGGDVPRLQALIDQHKATVSNENMPPSIGFLLASAYLLLGSKDEGVAVLRHFEKTYWNKKDADYLERMWLLLADSQDITRRSDEVAQLIFRAVEYNRASYLTNMYEGFHCGSTNHAKAAECFRRAMEATGGRDFVSGERYVWSQLNAHRPMEAIDGLAALERSCEAVTQGMKQPGSNVMTTVHMLRRRALAGLALRPEESGGRPDGESIRRHSRSITT
ncbi:hypothetical protein RvY_12693-2 [Ramazzottius varieornatus]|uniref:Uncharacterized protein n=1 Tax=Ramazzottius varieornatus TaxID=947166 RepID=A0A1D1VT00_RAMVA|nr:hypothetical protein RvY_12693-2 [Ramazzottius varieornatus]